MGRETIATDKIVSKGGGIIAFGTAGAVTVSDGGDFTMPTGTQMRVHGVPKIQRLNLLYGAFSDPSTTKFVDFSWADINANEYIPLDCWVREITNFTGGAVSAVECIAGTSATPSSYIAAAMVNLFSGAPTMSGLLLADRGVDISTAGTYVTKAATTPVRVTLTTTAANLDQLTAGEASVYFRYLTLPAT